MSFFKSLKGKFRTDPSSHGRQGGGDGNGYEQSPEISYDGETTKREKRRIYGEEQGEDEYTPPAGPPPAGSHQQTASETSKWNQSGNAESENPPPYQDWLSVPDNSQLPPPPSLAEFYSPTNNASEDSAEAGRAWCADNRVYRPSVPTKSLYDTVILRGDVNLEQPPSLFGVPKVKVTRLPPVPEANITSRFQIESPKNCSDYTLLSTLPLYFAAASNPLLPANLPPNVHDPKPIVISYTVRIISLTSSNSIVAIGLASKPYPVFRQPGWHRASIGVHSDDGRRYIHDPFGGIPFLAPVRQQDTITLTVTIHPQDSPLQKSRSREAQKVSDLPKCRTRVDVYRNGRLDGGWDMHEEKDGESDRGVEGLQGDGDLYAAVGVYGKTIAEVSFSPGKYQ